MRRSEFIHIISESIKRQLLNETASDKAALKYLETQGITDYNEKMRIIGTLKHDVPNLRLDKGKFVTAGLRMYYSGELSDEQSIRTLDTILNYIHKGNHASEYDFNLNGLSLNELSSKYKDNISIDNENDRKRSEQTMRNGGNGYIIIPIETYEQAHKYSQYTSWCVTNDENAFDSYTQGGNRFYFCFINGFENVPKNDNGAPLNTYGLSMIAVNIDMNGDLLRITTRYNHDFNGENNEGLCTVAQLEDILDVNFYKVFLPYTRDELHNRGIILFDEVQGLLDGGKNLKEIFDWCDDFYNGYARVRLNNKWNLISKDYRLLSQKKWFDYVLEFRNGYARVNLNNKFNFIDTNGNYLSEQWFDYCYDFYNGYSCVKINNKYNLIDTNGNYLSEQWFDTCGDFYEGYACVELNKKWNYIDTNGNYISEQWFDGVDNFDENGYAFVKIGYKWYKIDTNGQLYDYDTMQPINSQTTNNMTLNELKHIIRESIKRQLLNEGDSRLNKVMRIISDEFSGLLNVNGIVRSSEYYVNNNPNTTWGQYLLYSLRHNFGLMTNNDVKYLPFVAKIAFSDEVGFEKRNNNGEQLNTLRSIVQAIKKDPELYTNILNKGVDTYSKLVEMMTPYLQAKEQDELDNINNKEYTHNTDYDIIEIHSYEQAHEIGNYSSKQEYGGKLCYTQSEETWDSYTDLGNNRVFCLLKHGWKEMRPIAGENAPYDEYGLSMIFVFVNPTGKITTCNTRWNHEHSDGLHSGMSVDNSLSAEELSEIIGGNIYEALGINRLKATFDNVQSLLDKGYKPEDIFDEVDDFYNGYAIIELNNKYNFIDTNGVILSPEQWFDEIEYFDKNGYAKVSLNDKWNLINKNGDILSHGQWFDSCTVFINGYARVKLNNKWNFIDTKGNILSEQWFDYIDDFYNGYAIIELNNKYNFIDTNGVILSPEQWFDDFFRFSNGYAKVRLNNKYNFIDTNGVILSPEQWFDNVTDFHNGYARVKLNDKWNLIDTNCDYLSGQWFDYIDNFYNGYAGIELNNKSNFIDTACNILSPEQWFDDVDDFHNGYARVWLNGKLYKINTYGQLYDYYTRQPIDLPNTNNMTLNELKHIIQESIKQQLNNRISLNY